MGKYFKFMSRRIIIGGNWKCTGSKEWIKSFTKDTLNKVK